MRRLRRRYRLYTWRRKSSVAFTAAVATLQRRHSLAMSTSRRSRPETVTSGGPSSHLPSRSTCSSREYARLCVLLQACGMWPGERERIGGPLPPLGSAECAHSAFNVLLSGVYDIHYTRGTTDEPVACRCCRAQQSAWKLDSHASWACPMPLLPRIMPGDSRSQLFAI